MFLLKLVQSQRKDSTSHIFHLRQKNKSAVNLQTLDKSLKSQEIDLVKKIQEKKSSLKKLKKKTKDIFTRLVKEKEKEKNKSALFFLEEKGNLISPCKSCSIRRSFGQVTKDKHIKLPHRGLTFKNKLKKQKLQNVFRGRVVKAEEVLGYGKTIIIKHPENHYTVYAGLKSVDVDVHEFVSKGQTLGQIKDHFYFEIREFDQAVDPLSWLRTE